MVRTFRSRVVLAALVLVAMTSLAGCGARVRSLTTSGSAVTSSTVTSETGTATSSADASASAAGTSGATTPKAKRLSAGDAKAIDAELAAIESELDKMSVPSDNDFGGISSGLK